MKAIAALDVCLYLDQILGTDGFEQKNIKGTGGDLRRVPVLSDLSVFWLFSRYVK